MSPWLLGALLLGPAIQAGAALPSAPVAADAVAAGIVGPFIGPGSQLTISFSGSDATAPIVPLPPPTTGGSRPLAGSGCTANWVWKDQDGQVYLGTAGHCLVPEDQWDEPWDHANTTTARVFACRSVCPLGGLSGSVVGARLPGRDWVELGPVAYARKIGTDFGLVKVPDSLLPFVDPAMATWDGPHGVTRFVDLTDAVLLHGNGMAVAETFLTKDRVGASLAQGDLSQGTGLTVHILAQPGDSGAPLATYDPVDPAGARVLAMGILDTQVSETVASGSSIHGAIVAAQASGICLRLVLKGEDPASAPSPPSCLEDPCVARGQGRHGPCDRPRP